jgi:hypothetical protein
MLSISQLLKWRWAPCVGLVLGSLSFVVLALAFIPDHLGAVVAPSENRLAAAPMEATALPTSDPAPADNQEPVDSLEPASPSQRHARRRRHLAGSVPAPANDPAPLPDTAPPSSEPPAPAPSPDTPDP